MGGSRPSADVQLEYSTAPADRAKGNENRWRNKETSTRNETTTEGEICRKSTEKKARK